MPVSTQYNKAVVAGLGASCTTIIVALVEGFTDAKIGVELAGAITTVVTGLLVFLVPNKDPAPTFNPRGRGIL